AGGIVPVRLRGSRTVVQEARGRVVRDGLVGMERPRARQQHVLRLGPVRVGDAAVDRTDRGAGLVIEEADALGTLLGDDVEDVVRDGRVHRAVGRLPLDAALIDGGVGALRLAGPAVDAFAGDYGCHRVGPRCGVVARGTAARRVPKSLTFFGRWVKLLRDLWAPGRG